MDRQKRTEKSIQTFEPRLVKQRSRTLTGAVCAALVALQLSSCASYSDLIGSIRGDFIAGDYQTALEQIDKSKIKSDSSSQLLYHLERAMILDRIGKLDDSRGELLKADRIADNLYTVSLSKTAASFVVSDDVGDYAGEDYERVAIQTMLALSFIAEGDLSNAQVAARRINSKLAEIIGTYGKDAKATYSDDAFARYLAGMIHEARGDIDNAIVEYGKAIGSYAKGYQEFSNDRIPDSLQQAYYRLLLARRRADKIPSFVKANPSIAAAVDREIEKENGAGIAQVAVLHESGQISQKISLSSFVQVGSQLVRMSFPAIRYERQRLYGATGIELGDGKFIAAATGSDFDAIAAQSLEDHKSRIVAKGLTRALIKGQVVEQTRQNFGEGAGLLMNVITAATETADTRGWSLLPARIFVTRAWLKSGTHRMTLKTQGRETVTEVTLRPGEIKLLRASDAAPLRSLPTAGS